MDTVLVDVAVAFAKTAGVECVVHPRSVEFFGWRGDPLPESVVSHNGRVSASQVWDAVSQKAGW